MNGNEFIRKVKNLGKARGIDVRLDLEHGKGSHGRLHYGNRFTTIKDRRKEINPGLLSAMCKQLGIRSSDL
jgi:predicted RNA binding protein YcfA (HicA-like mRNA interferase family)